MKKPQKHEYKTIVQAVRLTPTEMQRLMAIAIKYESGNISAVLRKAALAYRGGK